MKNWYIIISLLFLVNTACKKNQTYKTFKEFPSKVDLIGFKTALNPHFKIAQLEIYNDSILLLHQTTHDEYMAHLCNKNNFTYISSIGKIGRGPNEIKSPGASIINSDGRIWLNDWGRKCIFEYQVDSLSNQNSNLPCNVYKTPSAIFTLFSFSQIYDSLFLYPTHNPDYYFYCANKNGIIIDSLNVENKTKIYTDLNRNNILHTAWYHHSIHPSKNMIVIAYMYSDIIVGIDFKGNIIFQSQGPDNFQEKPTAKNLMSPDATIAYEAVKTDNEYIYCLYQGDEKLLSENDEIIANYPRSILVFDWEGSPVLRMNLDHPAIDFVIDKNRKKIITYASDLGQVLTYDLPKELL